MIPLLEHIRRNKRRRENNNNTGNSVAAPEEEKKLRPLAYTDIVTAMDKVKPTGYTSKRYAQRRATQALGLSQERDLYDDED